MSNINDARFEIYLSKDTFKFNASHFVAYPGFRERLHGHNYRVAVKLTGTHQIGGDGYVLDFGCVKSAAKRVCKDMNEYFLVPLLSDALKITIEEGASDDSNICGQCDEGNDGDTTNEPNNRRLKRTYPGSINIQCEDGSKFLFPRQDCLLLPIMHSTCEELAIYVYGRLLQELDREYLVTRGVKEMTVTVSEAAGQDAMFTRQIPGLEENGEAFNVENYIRKGSIPPVPCLTETEAA